VATPQSRHWLGPAPLQSIAKQVASPILVRSRTVQYLQFFARLKNPEIFTW
jgi:hypothetical protein